jgi:MOSC domain-containing protein YiiM
MNIVSLNLGQPERLVYFGKETLTGGLKRPVTSALLRRTGFEGDGQADLKNHGGPNKAACVYSFDHYPYWEQVLGAPLQPGAFSENLTIAGLREAEVCIGDVFRVGGAQAQISQPRQPCSKLAGKRGRKDLPELIHANGFSGFYFRVLEEGVAAAGDAVEWVARHPLGVTVEFANRVMYRQRPDMESLERVLAVEALSAEWRWSLSRRLR